MENKNGDVKNKVPDASGIVTSTVLNTKISKFDNKIRDTSGLLTTTVLKRKIVELQNKIPNVSGLVRKQIATLKYQTRGRNVLLLLANLVRNSNLYTFLQRANKDGEEIETLKLLI